MQHRTFCEGLARQAGIIMKKHFHHSLEKEWKADATPVTIADKEINRLVITAIHEAYPGHDIIGEEESSINHQSEYVWVCDPVDGTIPYSHGIATAVFMLALVHNGNPIAGVVYDPFMDRMYYAEQDQGCFLNGERVQVNDEADFKQTVVGLESWSNAPFDMDALRGLFAKEGTKVLKICCIGYASMLIASGQITATLFAGTTVHDGAALKIIIEEAGGKVTDLFGNEQRWDRPIKGFIASNGQLHAKVVELVSSIIK